MIKLRNKYFFLLSFLLMVFNIWAKTPTGQWQAHLSYVDGQRLAISDSKVYCVASGSLFSYGINDNSIETYTKISGLSDVYINDIVYSDAAKTLVICYDNGNIDLMDEDGITNIPDLYQKSIYGDRSVNKVDVNGKMAYLSTGFGVLKINIEKAEIAETYKLTEGETNGVNGVAILDGEIYAATDNGLYKADLDNINLQNFANWSFVDSIGDKNLPVKGIITFNNSIVVAQYSETNSLYYLKRRVSDTDWDQFSQISVFNSFGTNGDILLVANESNIKWFNDEFSGHNISSYSFLDLEYDSQNDISVNHAIPIDENSCYVADEYQGLVYYQTGASTASYMPDGPATNTIWDIEIVENVLRTVHGAVGADYSFTRTPGAVSTFSDDTWTYIDTRRGIPAHPYGSDMVRVATDPTDTRHYYVAGYHKGIMEFYDDELIERYNTSNSTIEGVIGDAGAIRVYGLAFDDDNNLWVTNSRCENKIHCMTSDGDWYGFSPSVSDDDIVVGNITFVSNGMLWMTTPYWGNGIIAYNYNNTIDNDEDDESKYFSVYASNSGSGAESVSDNVYVITKDNDGTLWVGSDNGVALYYSPSDIFESSSTPVASRVNIPRNDGTGLGDYLLDGTTVQSIAVDGGNRKWLATASTGVMLVSSDGLDVVHHFTAENSPLLSNNVRQVKVNQETGEVFFATDAGLVSFQSDASSGGDDYSDLKVYPNPVREDYYGDITITGLIEETTVKITDVTGNLVNQTTSNGGTATWDATNFYGKRVGTGVYLIFCSNSDGTQSGMTKVLVIN